jgi:hypothetical protein
MSFLIISYTFNNSGNIAISTIPFHTCIYLAHLSVSNSRNWLSRGGGEIHYYYLLLSLSPIK